MKKKNIHNINSLSIVIPFYNEKNRLNLAFKNIDIFLKKFNKFGIPFNAFFSSKYPDGIIMSEILTEKEIIKSIEKLK